MIPRTLFSAGHEAFRARAISSSPQETAAFAARERQKWGEVVRVSGAKVE